MESEKKRELFDRKDFKWTKDDWTGVIAIALIIGLIISVIIQSSEGIAVFGPLAMYMIKKYADTRNQ